MRGRNAFTLIEVLVVLVIIAILVALLTPALARAVHTAHESAQQAEFTLIQQGLVVFKGTHGTLPPSRIVLSETGNYSPGYFQSVLSPALAAEAIALTPRSIVALGSMFPRAQVSLYGPTKHLDFNGNGAVDLPVILRGSECLVYFVGGQPVKVDGIIVVDGFSMHPAEPFRPGGSRSPLLFSFDPARLVDDDGNGYPSYVDRLGGKPLAYFSSYGGQGYDPDDVNDQAEPSEVFTSAAWPGRQITSAGPNPYTVTQPLSGVYHKAEAYQLLSAGYDGLFGRGGRFEAVRDPKLPGDDRNAEWDNLGSFAAGRMGP